MNGVAMAIYTIDNNTMVTAYDGVPGDGAGRKFASAREFTKASAEWPVSRLADTWNKPPICALKPVKKFMDRETAVARIWAAIQNLRPVPAPGEATGEKRAAKARKRPQPDGGAPTASFLYAVVISTAGSRITGRVGGRRDFHFHVARPPTKT